MIPKFLLFLPRRYIHMTDLVDQMFPPIHRQFTPEFTDFNYWRAPVQEFDLPDFSPPSPALSARSDTSARSTFDRIRNFSLGRQNGRQYVPANSASSRNRSHESGEGRRTPLRDVRSFEYLRDRVAGIDDLSEESGSSTMVESEDERRGRKLSMDSMPGSLPGSVSSHLSDRFGEDEEEGSDEYDDDEDLEDPEEAAEEVFDEDFRAMEAMESVPFL